MMTEFSARAVARLRDEDLGADVLVLAEHEDGSGRRLELQRSLEVTDEDRRLGMDTFCLVNETGSVHYGGVEEWSLIDSELRLKLTDEAAAAMHVDGGYRISLIADATEPDVVAHNVAAIIGDRL